MSGQSMTAVMGGDRPISTARVIYDYKPKPRGLDWSQHTAPAPVIPIDNHYQGDETTIDEDVAEIRGRLVDPRANQAWTGSGTAVDVVEATRRYLAGESCPQIGRALGHRAKVVRDNLRRAGVELRDDRKTYSGGRPRLYGDDTIDQVRTLYGSGKSMGEVAVELNLPYKSIVTIMNRHTIPRRTGMSGHLDGAVALKERMAALEVTSADVRAWARDNGVTMPARGLPARTVLDAYAEAHP